MTDPAWFLRDEHLVDAGAWQARLVRNEAAEAARQARAAARREAERPAARPAGKGGAAGQRELIRNEGE